MRTQPYASCDWLHDHIELSFDGSVHACCYRYMSAKGVERGSAFLCKIESEKFPADEIAKARERVHQEIIAGSNEDCCGCPVLASKKWKQPKYLVSRLTLNIWTHCNLKCRYCFTLQPQYNTKRVSYPVEDVMADMLRGKHLNPAGLVTWGGGDISALPEFNRLSAMFLDYGARQDFKTSAYKYLPGVANAIAARRGTVEVSVDAGTPETYEQYKGRDAYTRISENLLRYRQHGPVKLKYIAAEPNVSDADIAGFVELATRLRPTHVTITPEYGASWAKQYTPQIIGQIVKMVLALRAAGLSVFPETHGQLVRLFPDFWQEMVAHPDFQMPSTLARVVSKAKRLATERI